jgi:glycosyltransferase involved in cell wall biosynthesis
MNILHVVQAYYPFQEKGGPVAKVRALAKGLALRGHRVTVLTADLGLGRHPELSAHLEKCKWGWRLELDGIEIFYLFTVANHRALTLNPRGIDFCRTRLKGFDVVHFYGLYDLMGPAVSYFCRRLGVRYVIEPMGMYRPIDRSLRLKLLWHRVLGRSFLQGAARFITTSEIEQQGLLSGGFPPERVVVRYNGIDSGLSSTLAARGTFRAKRGLPGDETLVLFLSRLIPRKGADLLIEAFAQACPQEGRLVIAGPEGEPGYRAYLEKCARESGAEARILFTGPLYDEDKKELFQDADLFVLPSRYENFANVAAEAMACGVPVIISDACGIRSLVEGVAGLVIPPEKVALVGAFRALICDKDLYARFKEGCSIVASRLNWTQLSKQMETYYAEVLAQNNKTL